MKLIIIFILCIDYVTSDDTDDGSYSFHKFRGPVSGEIQEVRVPNRMNPQYQTVDFVARPDYLYSYGVEDPRTGNSQAHQESRDGDAVTGEYRVVQPDGMVRVVKYIADGTNGFRASVNYENP